MRVLVTRPEEDAAPLATALRARGHSVQLAPLLTILPRRAVDLKLAGIQALLITSANGLRAFARLSPRRDLAVYAVGDASAAAAREAGFAAVRSAGGDVEALARLVVDRLTPVRGGLLHPAGSALAGDLQGRLEKAGFTVRKVVVYDATAAENLSKDVQKAFKEGQIRYVALFSPRTGAIFAELVQKAGLSADLANSQALCLSDAVAAKVKDLPWGSVRVAAAPQQEALLACLDKENNRDGDSAMTADSSSQGPGDKSNGGSSAGAALDIINRFGGIRPMAAKLDVAVSTIQGWKERAAIPANRHKDILAAAKKHKVALDEALLRASAQAPATATTLEAAKVSEKSPPKAPDAKPADKPDSKAADKTSAKPGDTQGAKPGDTQGAKPGDKKAESAAAPKAPGGPQPAAAAKAPIGKEASDKGPGDKPARPATGPAPGGPTKTGPGQTSPIPPSRPTPAPAPAAASSGGWVMPFVLGAVIFAAGAVGAVVTRGVWQPLFGGGGDAVTASVAAIESRLAALEQAPSGNDATLQGLEDRLASLESAPVPEAGGADSGTVNALESQMGQLQSQMATLISGGASSDPGAAAAIESLQMASDDLAGRLAQLESAGSGNDVAAAESLNALAEKTAALAARVDKAEGDLAGLADLSAAVEGLTEAQSNIRMAASGDTAVVLGALQLRDALRGSGPYLKELQTLKELSGGDAALAEMLAPLDSHAASGLPSLQDLQAAFPAVAIDVVALERGEEGEGLVGGVLRRLSKLVTVRRTGMVEGENPSAVVARAEVRLNEGDLAGAVGELADLNGPSAEAAAGWLGDAQAKLDAGAVLNTLGGEISTRLSSTGG